LELQVREKGYGMKEKIIALIEEILMVPKGTVTETTMAQELEEWASLAQVMIVGELESKLGIKISLEEAMEIKGVSDILEKAGIS